MNVFVIILNYLNFIILKTSLKKYLLFKFERRKPYGQQQVFILNIEILSRHSDVVDVIGVVRSADLISNIGFKAGGNETFSLLPRVVEPDGIALGNESRYVFGLVLLIIRGIIRLDRTKRRLVITRGAADGLIVYEAGIMPGGVVPRRGCVSISVAVCVCVVNAVAGGIVRLGL